MIVRITVDRMDPLCIAIGKSQAIKEVAENYPDRVRAKTAGPEKNKMTISLPTHNPRT